MNIQEILTKWRQRSIGENELAFSVLPPAQERLLIKQASEEYHETKEAAPKKGKMFWNFIITFKLKNDKITD